MREKRFFIIDDNNRDRDDIRNILVGGGHILVGEEASFQGAKVAVETLVDKRVDVVTLDSNIRPGVWDGKDGVELLALIRKVAPGISVVGVSVSDNLSGADANVPKTTMWNNLAKVVAELGPRS